MADRAKSKACTCKLGFTSNRGKRAFPTLKRREEGRKEGKKEGRKEGRKGGREEGRKRRRNHSISADRSLHMVVI